MGGHQALGDLAVTHDGGRRSRHSWRWLGALALAAVWVFAVACDDADRPPIIEPAELATRLETGDAPFILDVRSPEEFAAGHLPGAVNVPHLEIEARLSELPSDQSTEIVVHCKSGKRASYAEETLAAAGYTNLRDLAGHYEGWRRADRPIEPAVQ